MRYHLYGITYAVSLIRYDLYSIIYTVLLIRYYLYSITYTVLHCLLQLRPQKITYSSNEWVNGVEQSLMVLLIFGRWLLPKGDLSHEQVSQVLNFV